MVALVRRPEAVSITNPKLTIIQGTPLDAEDVANALKGCDAVISTLNNPRTSDSPFAKPKGPANLMTKSIENTLVAMKDQGVRRIVDLTAAGVGTSYKDAPLVFKLLIKFSNLSHAYRDHEGAETALMASGLDWTIVRAVMLGKKQGSGPIIQSYENNPKPAAQIHRASVAEFMLNALDNPDLYQKAPVISQK